MSVPHRAWPLLGTVLAAAALLGGRAAATTYLPLQPEEMVLRADLVFFGTVTGVGGAEADGRPWTTVDFGDVAVLRDRAAEEAGSATPATVELRLTYVN